MLAVSMPNFPTSAALVDTATKCFATARSPPSACSVHSRALRAFVIVSSVVEDRAVLGHVDLVAAEHGVDALAQPDLLGEPKEEAEGVLGHAVLRVVEVQAHAFDRETLTATRIVGEELAVVDVPDLRVMVAESLPGG